MAVTVQQEKKKGRKGIPRELIYEMRYGKPIYYRDYDRVLSGEKTLEEVVGSSGLQSWIIDTLIWFLHRYLDYKKYKILANEVGFHVAHKSWRNLDIAIFERRKLLKEGISEKYVKIPPEVVIEIDTKADLRDYSHFLDYAIEKTQDLLDANAKKVIWIITRREKILVAEKGKNWIITDWNNEIEVIEGIKMNLKKLLEEEGIDLKSIEKK